VVFYKTPVKGQSKKNHSYVGKEARYRVMAKEENIHKNDGYDHHRGKYDALRNLIHNLGISGERRCDKDSSRYFSSGASYVEA
jgi:hypothetical protein